MTLSEVLRDEAVRLHEFPVAREKVFLAHAGDCPLPRRVAEAVSRYTLQAAEGDQEAVVYPAILEEGRKTGAALLGCQPDEVAFVGPTSLALSLFASGLKFRRHDNILIYFDDYPSNVYPWMALAAQGLEVRLMNTRGLGLIRPQDVLGQIDENTCLVALASCHFISGYRVDLATIGRQLRERSILFCLDAIQSLGAFPLPLEHVDLLAADAHKWLLGPCGAGLMYVRKEIQDRLNPPLYGWNNVLSPNFVAQEQIVFRTGAHKYEAGTYNLLGLVGLLESMKLLLEIGVEVIGQELVRKRDILVAALQAKGYTVVLPDAPPVSRSGIVSFSRPGVDLGLLHAILLDHKIITSLRSDRAGRQYIRLSPHFYNTDEELNRALELL
jgi:cysteine desulfurase / selenocysteine lyase